MNQEIEIPIRDTLDALEAEYGKPALARVFEFVGINTGQLALPELPPYQRPQLFYFPGLDGKPWYEASDYEELRAFTSILEAEIDMLRDEYLAQVRPSMLLPYEEQVAGRFDHIGRADWGPSISGARANARSRKTAGAAQAPPPSCIGWRPTSIRVVRSSSR
ncbi:hypothetical protein B7760_04155 [Burkholderia glumae]|uniref:hypothetical protein n=1 Tax=Burkholderia glumae TaxID=337 RepID=UPI0020960D73|nr:hypothetical protein [Burkholderia glumae]QKM50094.1 hypothetical protein B7760_04155 [Burkholderia glumae]